ncbi:TRAP dicarboxylate transporter subunit DctM [Ectopseudomonas mendocina]|jgi:tripartite ATP-independent transporter DctM subunit|uniref:TRAP transporter large permease protein n=4 Tax=Pseudomonadaceae TaxID=135621 RepID=A0A379IMT5_ECTME|nr:MULTISPECIES: TRAP transporter large permease subunit [Pseudomonas]AEB56291.1 TRAP C4-dicarboxylate transport system permease DctM subunit [Pseudomonas mendocina NK-01]ALN21287.1 C4-dicarboxylate ABC transporter permease [Pseudomonas mendocina S5.2]KES02401.1 C4-dicarboxylate ABC transporter permease [Pseudomonas mendocina]MDU9407452.1 TRAP transporter large permease subunit [Pseudomonas sp. zfem001]QNH01205.1 TRAP transporter large permease subunit [Pseudomonas sediminis]
MSIEIATYLIIFAIFGLLILGLPLAYVTGLVAAIFTLGWFGPMAVPLVASRMFGFITEYSLVAVPMFVFMAGLLDRSGLARDLFNSMRFFAGRLPGGVAVQTLVVAFFLAAISGIIGGEIVLLGLLALPQMLRLGYDKRIAIGVVCAGGSLGTMVPPSIVLIIYGLIASVSIADLFKAAVVPAFLLMGCYMIYVVVMCTRYPQMGGANLEQDSHTPRLTVAEAFSGMFYPVAIAGLVLGSIYGGIASVTEAAAMGALGVLLAVIVRGEFSVKLLQGSLTQTLETCGMIVWIGIGAACLVGVYNLMGGNRFVSSAITGLDVAPFVIILVMMLIFLVLGMILDWIGIAMLCLPIFVPIVVQLGYDPVWFGILFAVSMQVSYISPPFGPAAFYLKSVAPPDISLTDIFRSMVPFIFIQLFVLGLLLYMPALSTWLL